MIRVLAKAVAMLWSAQLIGAPEDEGTPAEWLEMLESPEFAVREDGCERLKQWATGEAEKARDLFLERVLEHEDPEVRMRCRELLRESVVAEYKKQGKGFVGIRMLEVQIAAGGGFGVRVIEVQPDTPAERAGMKVGDVIVELEGMKWDAPGASERFQDEVMSRRPGETVRMKVQRRGNEELLELEVKLAQRPPDQQLLWQGFRQDPEQLRKQQEEMRAQAEKRFFDRWLAERLRLRQEKAPPAGRR